jgi:hypothetical protein
MTDAEPSELRRRADLAELGRLANAGNATAADQLLELRSE